MEPEKIKEAPAFLLSWNSVTLYLVCSILAKPVLPHRMKETKREEKGSGLYSCEFGVGSAVISTPLFLPQLLFRSLPPLCPLPLSQFSLPIPISFPILMLPLLSYISHIAPSLIQLFKPFPFCLGKNPRLFSPSSSSSSFPHHLFIFQLLLTQPSHPLSTHYLLKPPPHIHPLHLYPCLRPLSSSLSPPSPSVPFLSNPSFNTYLLPFPYLNPPFLPTLLCNPFPPNEKYLLIPPSFQPSSSTLALYPKVLLSSIFLPPFILTPLSSFYIVSYSANPPTCFSSFKYIFYFPSWIIAFLGIEFQLLKIL